jgi:hypothetical protein
MVNYSDERYAPSSRLVLLDHKGATGRTIT